MAFNTFSTEGFSSREVYVYNTNRLVRGSTDGGGSSGGGSSSSDDCCDTSQWRTGEGVPSNDLGDVTDFYLDSLTGDVYTKDATGWVFVMNIMGAPGASSSVYKYLETNCLVTASDVGVAIVKDTANGIVEITVPTGVFLYGVNITGEIADVDDSSNLYIKIIYETEGTISQDLTSVDVPHVTYINTTIPIVVNSGIVSEMFPAPYDNTKTINLITSELDSGDAILIIKIESIVDDNFIVKLSF